KADGTHVDVSAVTVTIDYTPAAAPLPLFVVEGVGKTGTPSRLFRETKTRFIRPGLRIVKVEDEDEQISEADLSFVAAAITKIVNKTGVAPGPDLEPTRAVRPVLISDPELQVSGFRIDLNYLEAPPFQLPMPLELLVSRTGTDKAVFRDPPGTRVTRPTAFPLIVKVEDETVQITEADLKVLEASLAQIVHGVPGTETTKKIGDTYVIRPGLKIIKVEDETVEVSEQDITILGLVRIEGETVEISEGDITALGLVRIEDEVEQITEADLIKLVPQILNFVTGKTGTPETVFPISTKFIRPGLRLVQVQTEGAVEIAETDLNILGLVKVQTEGAVEISETDLQFVVRQILNLITGKTGTRVGELPPTRFIRPGLRIIRIEDETVEISETDLNILGIVKVQTEGSVEIAEADVSVLRKAIFDIVQQTGIGPKPPLDPTRVIRPDSVALAIVKIQDETVEVGEGDLHLLGLVRLQGETVEISEEDITVLGLVRLQDETVEISEDDVVVRVLTRVEGDTVQIAEGDLHLLGKVRVQTETLQIVETDIHVVTDVSGIVPPFVRVDIIVEGYLRDVITEDYLREFLAD
ncbi:MAG: hypothetical protein ACW99G_21545, partial [Candidatus Thorarchaeota archaeon]